MEELCSPSLAPDNDVFKHLATTYSISHGRMYLGESCKFGSTKVECKDYNYIWHGCMEITLELSCCKFPPSVELPQFWEDNRNSLLRFIGEAHKGVKGFVKDESGSAIEGASMKVKGRDVESNSVKCYSIRQETQRVPLKTQILDFLAYPIL
ncbi:CPM [Lepeophtheirus salmonis]|uniref:CPM n=1 Tax=Lepeophtheirus salmonis TaxID=72036 RepID=A0A7R8CVD9_LEPSM|nr:CPM [Lepeophtheirus salmonis]CAF2942611.1 CPM [Lepeophtheirus salmonis]